MCEVSNTVNIKNVVSNLKDNPVFRMSLASKELFHSNMLALMLENGWIGGLEELFAPHNENDKKLNDYKVLTVLREKSHFDLIIVFLPSNDSTTIKDDDRTAIADFFQNSEQIPEDLSKKLNGCKFAVVENKFKSIPNERQLNEYKKKAKITFGTKGNKIKMTNENTTFYLLAPRVSLDHFDKCKEWKRISWNKISDTLSEALKTKEKRDPFTAQFIEYYADFLKDILNLTDDIKEKLKSNDKNAFPNPDDITELRKIRIHDFYEKLWFSVLLNKIEITDDVKVDFKNSGYTRSLGLLDFKITDAEKHVGRGVQIQNLQLRVILEPQIAINKGDVKYNKWKGTIEEDDFTNYFQDIFKKIGKEPNKKLCKFGYFKYQYIQIPKEISIKCLSEMINRALDAIYHQLPSNLEAEEKK